MHCYDTWIQRVLVHLLSVFVGKNKVVYFVVRVVVFTIKDRSFGTV